MAQGAGVANQSKGYRNGVAFLMAVSSLLVMTSLAEAVRIKDIATIQGVRDNALIGYGLVIGLNGTGDKTGTTFTIQSLSSMLGKMGLSVDPNAVKVKNVAGVIVTAKLPPFMRPGSQIDVLISSVGDATSLQGGTLLLTPLKGPDQQIYAVAQGPVSIGGFIGGKDGDSVQKNHPTVGKIANGAVVEREVVSQFASKESVTILLRQQDFLTVMRMAQAINTKFGQEEMAIPVDAGTVHLKVPELYRGRVVELLATIEDLDVLVDMRARVVVNERTGTIVIGDKVRISDVAIAHGNLTIRVKAETQVSQPGAFAPKGETVSAPKVATDVKEEEASLLIFDSGATIGGLVRGLNAIGVSPRDLISILQAIKAAGALQADLEII